MPTRVAVAVVQDAAGRYLLSRRPEGAHLAGLWEFPGGKCRPGESVAGALRREVREELGVEIAVGARLMRLIYEYPGRRLALHFHRCRIRRGRPRPLEGQRLRWVPVRRLHRYRHPEANLVLLKRLALRGARIRR